MPRKPVNKGNKKTKATPTAKTNENMEAEKRLSEIDKEINQRLADLRKERGEKDCYPLLLFANKRRG